jgi:thymidine kinase
MIEFNFKTTEETYKYCCEVVECLMTYCGKTEKEALRLVNLIWKDRSVFDEDDLRLHEYPYYWAMGIDHHPILGDNKGGWYHDPQLWPPPPEYLQRYSL